MMRIYFRVSIEDHLRFHHTTDIACQTVYNEPFEEAYVAYLVADNSVGLELFQFKKPEQRPALVFGPALYTQTGCFHIAFTHPDPEALSKSLEMAGARQVAGPMLFGKAATILYLHDPWGVILEICKQTFEQMVVDAS